MIDKESLVGKVWKALPIYEESIEDYHIYINKLSIYFNGLYKRNVISEEVHDYVSGLACVGDNIEHDVLKATLFGINKLIKREGR